MCISKCFKILAAHTARKTTQKNDTYSYYSLLTCANVFFLKKEIIMLWQLWKMGEMVWKMCSLWLSVGKCLGSSHCHTSPFQDIENCDWAFYSLIFHKTVENRSWHITPWQWWMKNKKLMGQIFPEVCYIAPEQFLQISINMAYTNIHMCA